MRSVISGKVFWAEGGLWEDFSVERGSVHLKQQRQGDVERGRRSAHSSISAASRREWRPGEGLEWKHYVFLQMGNV